MRTIIAGSRLCLHPKILEEALKEIDWTPSVVLCGGASGADQLGKKWAENHDIPVESYPANWTRYGKAAGHIRNSEMARKAEALIALWDGESPGTKDMIQKARTHGLKIHIKLF